MTNVCGTDFSVPAAGAVRAAAAVVARLGRRAPTGWLVGSVVENIAGFCPAPVLMVRDADSRWVAGLAGVGESRNAVAHVAWPPAPHERLGVRASADLERLEPGERRATPTYRSVLTLGVHERMTALVSRGIS